MDIRCDTQYPILLVHGTGFRDKGTRYWGRIPAALKEYGATVYYGRQDSWGTIEHNAAAVARTVDGILRETGRDKVNIIAHSKGGLDARYMISSLGYAGRIASLTTVSTPHHGSRTMDTLLRLPAFLFHIAGFFVNTCYRIVGDSQPDFYTVCRGFSTGSMAAFNRDNPDAEEVYYQSFTTRMPRSSSDMVMAFVHFVVKRFDGDNDGLVSAASAQWGHFGGVWRSPVRRGISHADAVDLRRRNFTRKAGGEGVVDIRQAYLTLASGLRDMGL